MRFPSTPTGRVLVALALLVCTSGRAAAHPPADSSDADATSWYAFPTIFYTPETSLGLGAAGGLFVGAEADRPSSLQGDISATLNGQYALNLRPEWYRPAGRQRALGDIALSTYPDVFYGLGPEAPDEQEEDFTSRYLDAVLQAEQQVGVAWRVGLRSRVRREVVTEVEAGGLLDDSALPGHDASTVVGLGPLVARDTRDRLFYPRRGQFVTAYLVVHPEALGSTFGFTRVVLDARQYVPLGWGHTLAVQAYGEAVSGTAPFSVLPRLGGPLRMRGYLEGRFRDDVYATAQAEWRVPIRGRFDGALFASAGAVAGRLDALGTDGWEAAGGAGIRYRLNAEGVHIRLDYAIGRAGGGLYITARDPF